MMLIDNISAYCVCVFSSLLLFYNFEGTQNRALSEAKIDIFRNCTVRSELGLV